MKWFEAYCMCGITWWCVNAPFKEHVQAFRSLGFAPKLLYVLIQFIAIFFWPLTFIGWCVLRYKGIDPKEHGAQIAKNIEAATEKMKRDDEAREREQKEEK